LLPRLTLLQRLCLLLLWLLLPRLCPLLLWLLPPPRCLLLVAPATAAVDGPGVAPVAVGGCWVGCPQALLGGACCPWVFGGAVCGAAGGDADGGPLGGADDRARGGPFRCPSASLGAQDASLGGGSPPNPNLLPAKSKHNHPNLWAVALLLAACSALHLGGRSPLGATLGSVGKESVVGPPTSGVLGAGLGAG
jgi:hypothetical protein